jgi:hypothetical protein
MVLSTLVVWGYQMNKRLSAVDRHAVDLLLERPDASKRSLVEMVFARPANADFEQHLEAAEKVLSLLDNLPSAEPPTDLISRTMQRIELATLEPTAPVAPKRAPSRGPTRHA